MKTMFKGFLLALVVLWAGFALGYHRGVRAEQRAWQSTAEMDNNCHRIVYRYPYTHGVFTGPRGAENVPDLRNTPLK